MKNIKSLRSWDLASVQRFGLLKIVSESDLAATIVPAEVRAGSRIAGRIGQLLSKFLQMIIRTEKKSEYMSIWIPLKQIIRDAAKFEMH